MTSEYCSTQGGRDYLFSSSLSGDEKFKALMTEELTRVVPGYDRLGIFFNLSSKEGGRRKGSIGDQTAQGRIKVNPVSPLGFVVPSFNTV